MEENINIFISKKYKSTDVPLKLNASAGSLGKGEPGTYISKFAWLTASIRNNAPHSLKGFISLTDLSSR